MIHTRTITESDFPVVKALWGRLHAQEVAGNCWPAVPAEATLRRLCRTHAWAVAEEGDSKANQSLNPSPQSPLLGFAFWKIDPAGNASVQALAAESESAYLHLCLAILSASRTCGYGTVNRNRPEWTWFRTIHATFEACGYLPLCPGDERQHATRAGKLAARTPMQDNVLVPVTLIPTIRARLEAIG